MAVECIIVVNYWIEVRQLSASQVHTACFLSKGDGQRDYRLEDVNLHQVRSSHLLQLGYATTHQKCAAAYINFDSFIEKAQRTKLS